MTMPPRVRRLALTVHVSSSAGWIGAVVTFIGIAAVGLLSEDTATVRGAYLLMEPTAYAVLVPLAVLSLASGVVQSLGTAWGLLRHYWVVMKLVITVVATAVLLVYLQTFAAMAEVAANPGAPVDAVRNSSPLLHAVLALLLLLTAMVLAVYKPRGLTRRGFRREAVVDPPRRGVRTSSR